MMEIDMKTVRVYMSRVIRFIKKYPIVSSTVLFFTLLIFLPRVFYFLIFCSTIVACITISVRIYSETQRYEHRKFVREGTEEHTNSDSVSARLSRNRSNSVASLRNQKSVRRNVREKNIEFDVNGFNVGNNKDSKENHGDTLTDMNSIVEEIPKLITKENNEESVQELCSEQSKTGIATQNGYDEQSKTYYGNGGAGEVDVSSGDGEGEEEDEEETQEDGNNKVVQWTADDEKNLMDLGDSELERNRRLENLISKRKARKLYRLHAEKNLIDMDTNIPQAQVSPILISRNNPFDGLDSPSDLTGTQIPGSAPSVLLPTRNPFDLPYEPHEEKPDLTADSFNQEFTSVHPKEMLFCRHESFCWGPLESNQHNSNLIFISDVKAPEGPGYSRFKIHQGAKGNHDQLVEQLSSVEGGTMFRSVSATDLVVEAADHHSNMETNKPKNKADIESHLDVEGIDMQTDKDKKVQIKTDSNTNDGSSRSSSSEENGRIFDATGPQIIGSLRPTVDKFPEAFSNAVKKSIICPLPKRKTVSEPSYDSSPPAVEKLKVEYNSFYTAKGPCHTPSYSIASDLQVEVSELGSPITVDGNISSADEDSFTYDGDIDRDINSGSEEMWGASFHGVRDEESRLRELSEEDVKVEDPFALSVMSEGIVERGSNYSSSASSLRTENVVENQASISSTHKISDTVGHVVEDLHIGDASVTDPAHDMIPEKLEVEQEALNFPTNNAYNVKDPLVVHAESNEQDSKVTKDGNEMNRVIKEQVVGEPNEEVSNVDQPVLHANGDNQNLLVTNDGNKVHQIIKEKVVREANIEVSNLDCKSVEDEAPNEENQNLKTIEDDPTEDKTTEEIAKTIEDTTTSIDLQPTSYDVSEFDSKLVEDEAPNEENQNLKKIQDDPTEDKKTEEITKTIEDTTTSIDLQTKVAGEANIEVSNLDSKPVEDEAPNEENQSLKTIEDDPTEDKKTVEIAKTVEDTTTSIDLQPIGYDVSEFDSKPVEDEAPNEENQNLKTIEGNPTEDKKTEEIAKSNEDKNNTTTSIDLQPTGGYDVNPDVTIEQDSSSPNSVLANDVLEDQTSSSLDFVTNNVVISDSLDEQPYENLALPEYASPSIKEVVDQQPEETRNSEMRVKRDLDEQHIGGIGKDKKDANPVEDQLNDGSNPSSLEPVQVTS